MRFGGAFCLSRWRTRLVVLLLLLAGQGVSAAAPAVTSYDTASIHQAASATWREKRGRTSWRVHVVAIRYGQAGGFFDGGPATVSEAGTVVLYGASPCRDRDAGVGRKRCAPLRLRLVPVPPEAFDFDPIMRTASLSVDTKGFRASLTWTAHGDRALLPRKSETHRAGTWGAEVTATGGVVAYQPALARGDLFSRAMDGTAEASLVAATGASLDVCAAVTKGPC